MSLNITVAKHSCTQRRSHKTKELQKVSIAIQLRTVTFLRFVMFMFWKYYVLKLLHLETITFSDATLRDKSVVLCYVLSQYQKYVWKCMKIRGSILGLTVTGLHSEGRGRCPAHCYPSPGTGGCGSYTRRHSLGPRGCGSSSRGRGRLIRPPWVPPSSEQENFRLFWIFFWRMLVTPLLISPIL